MKPYLHLDVDLAIDSALLGIHPDLHSFALKKELLKNAQISPD